MKRQTVMDFADDVEWQADETVSAADFLPGDLVAWWQDGGRRTGTVAYIQPGDPNCDLHLFRAGLVVVHEAHRGIGQHFPANLEKVRP